MQLTGVKMYSVGGGAVAGSGLIVADGSDAVVDGSVG